jgi:hypothetical protein
MKAIEGVAPLRWCGSDCTYLAAMTNVLKVIGPPHDYARLFGDSGLAFRVRWWANDAMTAGCPSSPVGEMPPWTGFTTRSVGWKMDYVVRMDKPCPIDFSDQLERVKKSIDAGLPVLGYFKMLDVGIACGYDGTKLLIRDYWAKSDDETVDITNCRGMLVFFEERTNVPPAEESARIGVTEGVTRWSHPPDRVMRPGRDGTYYYGEQAYERWIALLKKVDELTPEQQKALLHVNYWTFINLHDARQKAAPYLQSIPQASDATAKAADIYQRMGEMTGRIIHDGAIFPAFYQPDAMTKWTRGVRQKEIETLKQLCGLDRLAIALLTPSFRSSSSPG